MRKLVYLDSALRDITKISEYLAIQSGGFAVGEAFAEKLILKCENLATLPGLLGTARNDLRPGLRSFAFKNYIILFQYRDDAFVVVNIFHSHRDIIGYFESDES